MENKKREYLPFNGNLAYNDSATKEERKAEKKRLRQYLRGQVLVPGTPANRRTRHIKDNAERGGKMVVTPMGKYLTRWQTVVLESEIKTRELKSGDTLITSFPTKVKHVLHYDIQKR